MKPIVFITKMDGGGMETFCLGLLSAMVKGTATLYTTYSGGVAEKDVPVDVERVCWNLRAKKCFLPLARWLRGRPEDPCLALSQELAVVLLVLKKLHLIKNRIYFRESTDVVKHYGPKFKMLMRWLWPSLDGIIEQSRVGEKEMRAKFGAAAKGLPIRFLGEVEDEVKRREMATSDCLILPTLSENFGLVVKESLECGVPVITTDGAKYWKGKPGVSYLEGYLTTSHLRRVQKLREALKDSLGVQC